jgi:hypothetical protein
MSNTTRNDKQAISFKVEKFLKGIRYPANKEKILDQAKKNKAPETIINLLNKFEEIEYKGPIDVSKEIKEGS